MKNFKSIFIAVVITICVMTCIGYCTHMYIIGDHDTASNEVIAEYEDEVYNLKRDLAYLESEHAKLEEGVYRMKNDKPYVITIDYDGATHTWSSDDNKGILKNESHSISHVSIK